MITVVASYTDGQGTAESVPSAGFGPIANVNDAPTGSVTISGTPSEDQILTAADTLADEDGLGPISYQWRRGGTDITGATSNTYTLTQADVGTTITVVASYTDSQGTDESVASAGVGPIANVNDLPLGLPTITGTAEEDQTLVADTSGISDADGLSAFSYQWLRDGLPVAAAINSTYLLGDADVGTQISVQISYTDAQGTAEGPLASTQTAPVTNVNDAPVGLPTITGTAEENQTLTADTSGISDADGLGAFSYQWLRDGLPVGGAINNTYLLDDTDVGTQISVQVSYTDAQGTAEGPLASTQTAPVANVNNPPVGVPTITGTAEEDQTLTADTSGISDADGLGAFSYQWLRDGLNIAGAINSTYLLGDADVGTHISVQVSYTDAQGTAEGPLASIQTVPVANVNDAPVGLPSITGTAEENQTLTADTSGISDADGLGAFSYQWLRDGLPVGGAINSTYLLDDADVGTQISVQVSYTDAQGTAEGPFASTQTAAVTNVNDAPVGLPTITGTAEEDQTLTADTSGISDADGLGAFSYQWLRDGLPVTGAINSTYLLDDIDVGTQISVQVSYTDAQGTAEGPLASIQTAAVTNVNDAPVGLPTITGTAEEDQTLTADTSGISDADGLGAFSYQWLRDGLPVAGAINSTYLLDDIDVDTQISVDVSYTDAQGTAEGPLSSTQTAPVTNVNDAPVGLPTITGTAEEDQTLTADTSGISDADGLGAFSYQWLRDGLPVAGAINSTYLLDDIDVGTQISVQVSYTDAQGTAEGPLVSVQTAPVTNINDAPVGLPTISGTVEEDQTLTADTSGISDADGLGAFSYQWLRDGLPIAGAINSTYLLGDADVGTQISVAVSYTDAQGTAEGPFASIQTALVNNVNDAPIGLPTITGTVEEDQTLIADTSGISDADGLGAFSYQWLRDGLPVGGAINSTYLLGDADVGTQISVEVSYTDAQGTAEGPLASTQTAPVTNVNDVPVGLPSITGTAEENQTLTADTSGISDADGLGTFGYQWLRDGLPVGGAIDSSYLLGDADVGTQIRVEVSYLDAQGTAEGPLASTQTAPVTNVNDVPVGLPTITGTAEENQTLIADTSGISDADGLSAFSYQWLRDGLPVAGAINSTYLLDDVDVATQISVDVSYTDAQGTAEGPLASIQTAPVTNINDAPLLDAIGNQTVNELELLSLTAAATDADLPANALTYSLDAASLAAGMTIDSSTGQFNWTPSQVQGPNTYSVTVTVTDDGTTNGVPDFKTSIQSFQIDVIESISDPITVEVQIAASSDDAEERPSGSVTLTSSDLELTHDGSNQQQVVGMRFPGLNIPPGASIQNAYLQFQADETGSDPTSLAIYAQAVDNATTFTNTYGNISSRTTTSAFVPWSPAPWTTRNEAGPNQRTPNIATVIQEIVDRPGWSGGNALAVIITGTGKRTAESFNGVPSAAPLLHVEYVSTALNAASQSAPPDSNGDGSVSVIDALLIINNLSSEEASQAEGETLAQRSDQVMLEYDLNRDGKVSALDVLQVINYLSRSNATVSPTLSAEPIDESQLAPIVDEAILRLSHSSPYDATSMLAGLNFEVVDLPGNMLGRTSGNTIRIDVNAAGFGWFVDPKPHDDVEFMVDSTTNQFVAPQHQPGPCSC